LDTAVLWRKNEWENGYFDESVAKNNKTVTVISKSSDKYQLLIETYGENIFN
jgi:hypothetical protein